MYTALRLLKFTVWQCILQNSILTVTAVDQSHFLLSDCTCVGSTLTFECTADGLGATIWKGSAFNCPESINEIQLLHSRFDNLGNTRETCNNGGIIGYSVGVLEDRYYRSRLSVQITQALNGTSVVCEYDNGITVQLLNSRRIMLTTEPLPPPMNIHLMNVRKNQLVFTWDPVNVTCSAVRYNIQSTNCGECPSSTSLSTVACTDLETIDRQTCVFGVSTVACSNIVGARDSTEVQLEVPDITSSRIVVIPTYDNKTGNLTKLSTLFNKTRYTTYINKLIGAATSYTINYTNSDTGKSCGNSTISAMASCTNGSCEHDFLISSSTCQRQANLSVTIFGSNKLGDGRISHPIKRSYVNSFVKVDVEENSMILCKFLTNRESGSFKSCNITYFDKECQTMIINLNNYTIGDVVYLSLDSLPIPSRNTKYCFLSTANDGILTVNIKGTYDVIVDMTTYPPNGLMITLGTIFPIIVVVGITMFGILSVICIHRLPKRKIKSKNF